MSRPTRLRVALVAHHIHRRGGQERALAELIARTAHRVDYHVVSCTLDPSLVPLVRWHRVRAAHRPFVALYGWFWRSAGRVIARLERDEAIDLVHTCGAIVGSRADVIMVPFSHRAYVEAVGGWTAGVTGLRRVQYQALRAVALAGEWWCYRPDRARVLAPVSPGAERALRRFHPRLPTRVIPNGVDLDRFRPDAGTRRSTRQALGVEPDRPVVVFVGGDWERKGLAVLVDALGRLARNHPAVDPLLLVVGVGDVAPMTERARTARVPTRFLGERDDIEAILAGADVFCLPTEYETFSMVSYEAAACGLPVVATAVSGIEDLVDPGVSGFLVDRNPTAVARALVPLLTDPELRRAMGAAGTRRVEPFGWDAATDATVALYRELADAGVAVPSGRQGTS